MREHCLAGLGIEVYLAHHLAFAAALTDGNGAAIGIFHQVRTAGMRIGGIHKCVRVAAYHEVDVMAFAHYLHVVECAGTAHMAYVRHHHHIVGYSCLLQIVGQLQCHCLGIDVAYAHKTFVGYHTLGIEIDAHKGYALAAHMLYHIGLKHAVERCARHIVVGRKFGGFYMAQMCRKFVNAVVEFVIAGCKNIKPEAIDCRILHVAAEKREKHGALHCIAGMHGKHIFIGTAHAVHHHSPAHQAAFSALIGHHGAMGVVGC